MATILTSPSNGVSYGYKHTVSSTDASDGYVEFDFQVGYPLSANITVLSSADAVIATTGAVITYPANGKVRIASGGSFTVTAGYKINIVAQFDKYGYSSVTPINS